MWLCALCLAGWHSPPLRGSSLQQEQDDEHVQGKVLLKGNPREPQHGLLALVSALVVGVQPGNSLGAVLRGGRLGKFSGTVVPQALGAPCYYPWVGSSHSLCGWV